MKAELTFRGNELINRNITPRITGGMVANIHNMLTVNMLSAVPGIW